jgi:two-component sensor histidine kinase
MPRRSGEQARWALLELSRWRAWGPAVGLGTAVGLAYFLAAELGAAFLGEADGVPLLWPAAGLAAGALMVLDGRSAKCAAAGILAATVAANLRGEASIWASVVLGLCNAGEAMLAAWLVHRWSRRTFKLEDLRAIWGLLAAAALAPMVTGAVAAIALLPYHATLLLPAVWRAWALPDTLGIVTVAPLVVGLHGVAGEPAPRDRLIEGMVALALLAAGSAAVYAAPTHSWLRQVPQTVLFPLVLWIAARCPPVLSAAAALVISSALVAMTTMHLGRLAAADMPAFRAQITMLVASICALTLAALFAERRRSEGALMESNERLRLALGGAELGVWSVNLATGAFESDERDRRINGHDPAAPPRTLAEARKYIKPEDLAGLDKAFAAARFSGAPCRAEYRVLSRSGAHSGQLRWVAVEGNVARDAAGRPIRLLGVTRDITQRKLAEEQKDLLLAELDHRVKNALAVVSALISRSQETSGSVAELVTALDGRIKSMATAHELLSRRKWHGLSLGDLIERELEPYATGSNVDIGGPDVMLKAEAGQALAMVVHELATNAAKYGALSDRRGRVSVRWRHLAGNGAGAQLALDWVETDGPAVVPSSRVGYGTSVIRDLIPYELGGSVDLKLAPEGVRCRLRIPATWLSAIDRTGPPRDAADAAPERNRVRTRG